MQKVVAIIPARYDSSRFPGKPLALIAGKSMIQRVYEAVRTVDCFADVIVATDDERIEKEVLRFGGTVVMTGKCSCGTERVYEAAKNIEADIIVNVQGDEPLINKDMISDLLKAFDDSSVRMATLKRELCVDREIDDSNVVKVVTDKNHDALYFSRWPIPFRRGDTQIKYYKHIGIYGYTKEFLKKYVSLCPTQLEKTESLEQLRVLENGYKIRVLETKYDTIGVDTPMQLKEVEKFF